MRKKFIIGLLALAFATVVAAICLLPERPHPGPWKLSDGSELSLAGVTYGKKHAMRYGNGIADYLYPILSPALRKKFKYNVTSITTLNTNAVILWFRDKDLKYGKSINGLHLFPQRMLYFSTVDENGTELTFNSFPISTVVWNNTNALQGFELGYFPRREKNIQIRIFELRNQSHAVAELTIPNRASTNYPVWTPAPLPVRVRTNDLDVSLLKLETIPGKSARGSYARAEFRFTRNDGPCDDWTIYQVTASAATGEGVPSEVWNQLRSGRQTISVNFKMPLWTEEPAWKLTAELWRNTNYPSAECWTAGGVAVPDVGQTDYLNVATNIYGRKVEVLAIRGGAPIDKSDGRTYRTAVLVLRSPMGVSDARVRLAEVTDNLGRKVAFEMDLETADPLGVIGTLDKEYTLNVPNGAKTLDVTAAYTKTVVVDFMARPVLANAKQEPKK